MKACIFDLDGTLFQTERIAVPAFEKTFQTLHKQGMIQTSNPTEADIRSVFGLTGKQFWAKLLPEADESIRNEADQWLLKYEKELINKGKGKFYPGVQQGLRELKDLGWSLFLVSNGIREYVNAVLASGDLQHLFTEVFTLGDQPELQKKDVVQELIRSYSIKKGYVIGDRNSDIEAGTENGLTAIGCRYKGFPSFGDDEELKEADHIIQHFQELIEMIKSRSHQRTYKETL